jgi:thiol-disulfide isomerase/thioredoxin
VSLGISVLLGAVVIGVLLSVFKARFDGRFRGTRPVSDAAREKAAVHHDTTPAMNATPGTNATAVTNVTPGTNTTPTTPRDRLTVAEIGSELGERATLLQFSSAFCAPCRATRRILGEVESMVEGVRHVELDAESHLDLVRRLDILRTPTVLVLDAAGAVVTRASGQPRKADVIAALGAAVDRQPR